MGVAVWESRRRAAESEPLPPRVRLEAGSGRWLLVVDADERARHRLLLTDIRALLGSAQCRFGTWSDTADAGVAAADWGEHGIAKVLAFGVTDMRHPMLIRAPALDALAREGVQRRRLWQLLRPELEGA